MEITTNPVTGKEFPRPKGKRRDTLHPPLFQTPPRRKQQTVEQEVAEPQVDRWMSAFTPQTKIHTYLVDNSLLKSNKPGLGYRLSPNLEDGDFDAVGAPWGSTVE